MSIVEYGDFSALYIFGILLLPAVILGCLGKKIKWYGMCISIPILYMLMGDRLKYFLLVAGAMIVILYIYYRAYSKWKNKWIYYLVNCSPSRGQ